MKLSLLGVLSEIALQISFKLGPEGALLESIGKVSNNLHSIKHMWYHYFPSQKKRTRKSRNEKKKSRRKKPCPISSSKQSCKRSTMQPYVGQITLISLNSYFSSRLQRPPLPQLPSCDPPLATLIRCLQPASGSSADWVACCCRSIARSPSRNRTSMDWAAFLA